MTAVQLASASKTSLLDYIEQLKSEVEQSNLRTQEAVNYANYFSTILSSIETILNNSPFKFKDGKVITKIFWVVTNIKVIIKLIEDIVAHIRLWRAKMEEIMAQQAKAASTPA